MSIVISKEQAMALRGMLSTIDECVGFEDNRVYYNTLYEFIGAVRFLLLTNDFDDLKESERDDR